jgi:inosose dehydratase
VVPIPASPPSVTAPSRRRLEDRIAAAPISWGVCEVPDWGVELPPERVLAEMHELGLRATELGPGGYLGASPAAVATILSSHGLTAVGGFVPVVLHERAALSTTLESVRKAAELFRACGARFLVSAPVTDMAWAPRVPLDPAAWRRLAEGLEGLDELAAAEGLEHVLHPHVGSLVETREDVDRVLEVSGVAFCLDTGHFALGGIDPLAFVRTSFERVRHVHLKDVADDVARRLRNGELTFVQAVREGLFTPLGAGDAPVAETVSALERAGYTGWYVLEQDTALTSADTPPGGGPAGDVRRSIQYLRAALPAARATTPKEGSE